MVNKSLFASMLGRLPKANAVNEAGGRAYKLEPKHALAQVAATGTFGNAFYSTAETQLDEVLKLIDEVNDNQYLAKLALYAREKAFMKDMPAALLVALSVRDTELMHRVFDRVVDNGRVLRTVFQMIRSGQFKSKSGTVRTGLSSSVQRAFQRWLNNASVGKLLSASIGNDPSLRLFPLRHRAVDFERLETRCADPYGTTAIFCVFGVHLFPPSHSLCLLGVNAL